ncbi:glycerate kinase [Nocardia sp. NPDC052566]|uniref:glycerate kinase n=1 Tax=Nocardia sp. NPDC052566 TaxID=3364330 RepID=UPI0037C6EC26
MRVLIAPDKFKGSLTATEVADHLAHGLAEAGAHTRTLPLADGGDGSVAAALAAGFRPVPVTVHGATGEQHDTVIACDGDVAIVEVANTCGLAALPAGPRDALAASSYGFGEAIRAALRLSPERLVLALGGSASTDGGIGMLAALGYRFLDPAGRLVTPTARHLDRIHRVDGDHAVGIGDIELVVASDVTSPLLGSTGAATVFGPQKGADAAQVAALEAGLTTLVDAFARSGYHGAATAALAPGSGAAGGIGFAATMLAATVVSGADYFLDLLDFDRHAAHADLIITGEGRLDEQTLHGKLPAAVAARVTPTPLIAVVGRNDLGSAATANGFADVIAVGDLSTADTTADPLLTAHLLRRIGTRIGRDQRFLGVAAGGRFAPGRSDA